MSMKALVTVREGGDKAKSQYQLWELVFDQFMGWSIPKLYLPSCMRLVAAELWTIYNDLGWSCFIWFDHFLVAHKSQIG